MDVDLQRFVDAQDAGGSYRAALAELQRGRKTGHWIWYVLPQLAGLGRSAMSEHYGISGRKEALAYLAHPVLGPRLRTCTEALARHADSTAEQVLGSIDAMKVRSCMTLFDAVAPAEPVFGQVLDQWYDGRPDPETVRRL